jgi:hypothetical protein
MTAAASTKDDDDARDVLVGAGAIARELGVSIWMVYRWHSEGTLPIGKLGRSLIASRSKLRLAVQQMT